MGKPFHTYNPKSVNLIIGGNRMSGFAEGTMITISRDAEAFSKQVGVDGEVTRSKSNNKAGKVKFTLMQSSDSNKLMSDLALVDEISTAGVVPVLVEDKSGTSLCVVENAWVEKVPDSEFSRNASGREWVMDCADLINFIGGN